MTRHLQRRAAQLADRLAHDADAPPLPRTPMSEWTRDELLTAIAWDMWRDGTPDGLADAQRLTMADLKRVADGEDVERPPG
jgi:hypothetical protein